MRRALLGMALCAVSVMVWAPAARANPDAADVSVSIAWIGKGHPRVHNGATAMWTVTITNHGPNDAQQTELSFFGTDQWDQVVSACGVGFCDLGTVAAAASVTVTISARVCGFVTGESRDARVVASVSSATPDPDQANNSTGDFVTKIVGPHGEPCVFP